MQITIDDQTFTVTEDSERLTITDTKDNVIGIANDMQGATAICEQIAWKRRVDGKVDKTQKVVDKEKELQVIDDDPENIQFCLDCCYFQPSKRQCVRIAEIPRTVIKCNYCQFRKGKDSAK